MEPDAAILVWQRNLPRKLNLKARKRQSTRDGAQEAATPLAIALDYVARVGTQCRFHFGRKSPSMIIGRGAGPNASAEILELARRIAEAQIDIHRARTARHRFLSAKIDDPYYESRADTRKKLALLRRSIPYLLRDNPPIMLEPLLVRFLVSTPQGPHKLATILSEESRHLLAMDRYEQRAISRRKFAIRAYDEARRRAVR